MILVTVSGRTDSYVQFMTILVLFVFVLGITWFVTRWIGGYQKSVASNTNMEVVETLRMPNNKYLQIIRIGQKYLAVAICKDSVTMLTEIPKEDLCLSEGTSSGLSGFKDVLSKIQKEKFLEKEDGRDE